MTEGMADTLTFTTFDETANDGSRFRWWVLRGPQLAISLTAVVSLPWRPDAPDVLDADGNVLTAYTIAVHHPPEPGQEPTLANCPALEGRPCGSDQGGSFRQAAETLHEWARAGRNDKLIEGELRAWYADRAPETQEEAR